MLIQKKCSTCSTFFYTCAQNPVCRNCVKLKCCMSHLPSSDGRTTCNVCFDMIKHNGSFYCLGHYKILQNRCNICGVERPSHYTDFQQDHMWYCSAHIKSYKQDFAHSVFQSLRETLHMDIIFDILAKVTAPAQQRYPSEFHIPVKKSLK